MLNADNSLRPSDTKICVNKLTIIGSDNGLSPSWRKAIIWTNAGILLIRPVRPNFIEISIEIHIFSFKKMHLKISSAKWRTFCLSLNAIIRPSLRPVSLMIFCPKFKFYGNLPCCNSVAGHLIATNFCICHDSTAVVPCTKVCSDHCIKIEGRVKRKFHRIWVMEKPLVKRRPGVSYLILSVTWWVHLYCWGCVGWLPSERWWLAGNPGSPNWKPASGNDIQQLQ